MVKTPNNLLLLAEKDLEASNIILNSTNDELMQNIAAYHTQQAVEKTLKHLKVEYEGRDIDPGSFFS